MAMHPALIAGCTATAKRWREVAPDAANAETSADTATTGTPEPTLDLTADLRSLGHLAHRVATLCGVSSVALLWVADWLGSAPRASSDPVVPIGVATSVLAVLCAVVAVGLELLTRVRLELAPRLTTLEEHRRRIEAESAAFRESLPTAGPEREPRTVPRRGRFVRQRRRRRS